MNFKFLYLLITPLTAAGLSIPIVKASPSLSNTLLTHHYLFRLPLLSEKNKLNENLIKEDQLRLKNYYKKYFPGSTNVNLVTKHGYEKIEGSQNPNLFIQIQKSNLIEHKDLEWLKTVKLNQITIDRLYEKKEEDTDLISDQLYKEILKTEHFIPKLSKLSKNAQNQESIDLFFKNIKIPSEEIKRLVYFPSSRIGAKRWFVWLDKDILRLKLDLGFQVWLFNQPFLKKQKFYKELFKSQKKIQAKKELRRKLNSLYKELSEQEKEFFEFYYKERWSQLKIGELDNLSLKPGEISSKEINYIYNLLKERSKELDIFKGHLLQVVQGGDKTSFESFFPGYVTYASGPDAFSEIEGSDKYKENAKLTITIDKSLNDKLEPRELYDIFSNHSIQHFTLRTTNNNKEQWPSINFDSSYSEPLPVIREKYLLDVKTI